MPGVYTLEWKDGRKEEACGHRGYYYLIDDHNLLSFLPEPAWCHACGRLTLCESLETAESIQSELDELDDPESERSKQLRKSPVSKFPETWKHRRKTELRHISKRQLPASCLTCGGREVSHFPENEWVPHPVTGQEVRMYCSGMCSTDFAMKFYDVDGNPLNVDKKERDRLIEMVNSGNAP